MYAGINGNMLGKCCSEHDIIEMVRGEGSEGPLFAVCSSRYSGRIESVEGDSCIGKIGGSSHYRHLGGACSILGYCVE